MSKQSGFKGHNLKPEQLKELQNSQMAGENIATASGSMDKEYKIAPHEKHLIHARLTTGGFDPVTGEPLSKPVVQTFNTEEFKQAEAAQTFAGMKVEILHDPSKQADDIEPTDYLKVQVVSSPGAGMPLTETIEEIAKKKPAEIAEIYSKAFPNKTEAEKATSKKDMIEELGALIQVTKEEADHFKSIEQNRMKGAENGPLDTDASK